MLHKYEAEAANPDLWNNPDEAQKVLRQRASLEQFVARFQKIQSRVEDAEALFELVEDEDEADQEEGMFDEVIEELNYAQELIKEIEFERMLGGEADPNNAIVSLNAGAGGTESCDWTSMLLRMLLHYCEKRGWKTTMNDYLAGDEAGVKNATFTVEGEYAYGYLKAEAGVHRLVRISPFDSNARRHTSFSSVFVFPELDDDIEVEVNEGDLRVDTYRASGAGGQHVNKTDSAVRLTHLPTGIVVQCQNERSQHKNRAYAMKMLKSRLYELELQKKQDQIDAVNAQKKDIAWGSQIRSYVMQPYRMVKDLRTNTETSDVESVLNGKIDQFIEAYLIQFGASSDPTLVD
jgi:peptide chain release factor 2